MRASARFYLPLLTALALFAVDSFFQANLWLAGRYGLDTVRVERVLAFLVAVPLILFTVRALELVAFDFFVFRQKHVRTPVLLREIFSIVPRVSPSAAGGARQSGAGPGRGEGDDPLENPVVLRAVNRGVGLAAGRRPCWG